MEHATFNRTKIIATLGPACNNKKVMSRLVKAGVDVFRINFSHGSREDHKRNIRIVRELNKELGSNISLLQDLQGPKIRTLDIENGGVEIVSEQELLITMEDVIGNNKRIGTTYKQLASDVEVGDMILIDDGSIEIHVIQKKGDDIITRVIHGGILKSRKGINLPESTVSAPSLTPKDEEDLMFGLEYDMDWVALSFIRSATDIHLLKERIKKAGKDTRVIAKIEKPEAIKNIDEIIEVTDGLMVARGDLGVEIPMEKVPIYQKIIVDKCVAACKPVIIATQMMESMINNPRPTRAETNDVANAVLDGADAVMLSAETATGKYPEQVIRAMVKIISSVEESDEIYDRKYKPLEGSKLFYNDSLVRTACELSRKINAKALIGMSQSGYTAFRLACQRPKSLIYIFTRNRKLMTILNLVWSVKAFYFDKEASADQTFPELEKILINKGILIKGDVVAITASTPFENEGRTNMLKIDIIE